MAQLSNKSKYRRKLVTGMVTATIVSFLLIALMAISLLEVGNSVNRFGFYSYRQIHITLLDATRLSDALITAQVAPGEPETGEILLKANDLAYIRFISEDRSQLIEDLPVYEKLFTEMETIIEDVDGLLAGGLPLDLDAINPVAKRLEQLLGEMNEVYYAHGNDINKGVTDANSRLNELSVEVGALLLLFWAMAIGAAVLLIRGREAAAVMRHQATHDSMTGLKNRAWLAEHNENMFDTAHMNDKVVMLVLIDIDRFKEVNDTYGHHVGDLMLKWVAGILTSYVTSADVAAVRLGGDEMAILAIVTDEHTANELASSLHQSLNTNVDISGHNLRLGASLGMALYPKHGGELELLTRNADLALYRAKEAGRARLVVFDPEFMGGMVEKGDIQARIRKAIDFGEFELLWQPMFELRTGRLTGAEALLRWHDSVANKTLMPKDFLPLAEQSDLIYDIDRMVLVKSCAEAARWEAELKADFVITVNISARNLEAKSFPDFLVGVARRAGLTPQRLEIDITEDIFIADRNLAFEIVRKLRGFGFRVALDNFGTGTADLEYLAEVKVDRVKIDGNFIKDIQRSTQRRTLVQSIINTGKAAGADVVAGGVETEDQIGLLVSLGCDFAQGYALAKPTSSGTFRQYLQRTAIKDKNDKPMEKGVA